MTRIAPYLLAAAMLAACGEAGNQQQAGQEPYSAPSSPNSEGAVGYPADPGIVNQQNSGAEGGRGSAATGATSQGVDNAADGAANTQQQGQTR